MNLRRAVLIDRSVNRREAYPWPATEALTRAAREGGTASVVAAMFRRVRYFLSDVGHWFASHLPGKRFAIGLGAVVLVAAVAVGGYFAYDALNEDEPATARCRPGGGHQARRVLRQPRREDLGFPAFATRNTTRVAGADAVADAAAVALATFPSTGGLEGPAAVSIVDAADWPGAIAAASLAAEPVSAPILFSEDGEIPELTESALVALAPGGSAATGDDQVFVIGDAAEPEGLRSFEGQGAESRPRSPPRSRSCADSPDRQEAGAHPRRQLRRAGARDARGGLGGAKR